MPEQKDHAVVAVLREDEETLSVTGHSINVEDTFATYLFTARKGEAPDSEWGYEALVQFEGKLIRVPSKTIVEPGEPFSE